MATKLISPIGILIKTIESGLTVYWYKNANRNIEIVAEAITSIIGMIFLLSDIVNIW